jgi:DNA invertase Pin-like site-specific DNA recombinase
LLARTPRAISKLGLARARANGRIGGGRYKLSRTQQEEAIKMIRLGEKSQAEVAELFNVDRSTVSRMMKEVREKDLLKAARSTRPFAARSRPYRIYDRLL